MTKHSPEVRELLDKHFATMNRWRSAEVQNTDTATRLAVYGEGMDYARQARELHEAQSAKVGA